MLRQSTVLVQGFDYCCLFFIVNKLIVQTQLSTKLASIHHPQLALPTLARPRGRVSKSLCGVNIYDTTPWQPQQEFRLNNRSRRNVMLFQACSTKCLPEGPIVPLKYALYRYGATLPVYVLDKMVLQSAV
jgi:hypothetical protein